MLHTGMDVRSLNIDIVTTLDLQLLTIPKMSSADILLAAIPSKSTLHILAGPLLCFLVIFVEGSIQKAVAIDT